MDDLELRDQRVLITGANGFIGGRLAERLAHQEGARVRAMVRRSSPVVGETIIGDVTDADAVSRAAAGCDVVIHCAARQGSGGTLDDFRRVNVEGTLNLLGAAQKGNVARFIHISTINVHGYPPPQGASADSPLCFKGDFYSVSKAEGERAAWQFAREYGFPLTVIRPACTYGPRSEAWTLGPLRRVRRGRPVLIGRGEGICNAVYIDNLVDMILLALKSDAAIGETFIGAEGQGVTWREFYGAYAQMLGGVRLYAIPRSLALIVAAGFEVLSRFNGSSPRIPRSSVEFYSHRVVFDIGKAQKLLGYTPRVSFAEGMENTRQWLIESGILPNMQNPKS